MTRSSYAAILLLAPAIALFALLTIYPLGRAILLSFFETDYGFDEATYVGLENFQYLFDEPFFHTAIWNTVAFTLMATVSEVAMGLLLALMVYRPFPGRWLVIPTLIAPFVLSTMVVTAIWRAWFHFDFGFLNNVLRSVSLPPVKWLFDPDIAMISLVLVDLWQTAPLTFLILLAGLQSISPETYEAARMDGAGLAMRLLTVVLPIMTPGLIATAVFLMILSWNEFIYALLFIQTPSNFTLPTFIATLITEDETFWGRLAAIGFLSSLPILAMVGIVQRGLTRGFAGGLK